MTEAERDLLICIGQAACILIAFIPVEDRLHLNNFCEQMRRAIGRVESQQSQGRTCLDAEKQKVELLQEIKNNLSD